MKIKFLLNAYLIPALKLNCSRLTKHALKYMLTVDWWISESKVSVLWCCCKWYLLVEHTCGSAHQTSNSNENLLDSHPNTGEFNWFRMPYSKSIYTFCCNTNVPNNINFAELMISSQTTYSFWLWVHLFAPAYTVQVVFQCPESRIIYDWVTYCEP